MATCGCSSLPCDPQVSTTRTQGSRVLARTAGTKTVLKHFSYTLPSIQADCCEKYGRGHGFREDLKHKGTAALPMTAIKIL